MTTTQTTMLSTASKPTIRTTRLGRRVKAFRTRRTTPPIVPTTPMTTLEGRVWQISLLKSHPADHPAQRRPEACGAMQTPLSSPKLSPMSVFQHRPSLRHINPPSSQAKSTNPTCLACLFQLITRALFQLSPLADSPSSAFPPTPQHALSLSFCGETVEAEMQLHHVKCV